MENIHEILKKFNIEVPEEKKENFDKLVVDNYKTINEVQNIQSKLEKAEGERDTYKNKYDADISQRDSDIADLKSKLKDAGTDAEKLATLENDLAMLQTTYETAKTDYEKQLAKQAYEFAVKQKVASLKFSSNSAKRAFIEDAMKEELKLKDGELQGFEGFLKSYKENDADAFLEENTDPEPTGSDKPQFSGRTTSTNKSAKPESETKKENPVIW